MSTNSDNAKFFGKVLLTGLIIGLSEAGDVTVEPVIEPRTPTHNRVDLAAKVATMDGTQIHAIARTLSDNERAYGLQHLPHVSLSRWANDDVKNKGVVLNALASVPDENLVSVAVLIAGQGA